MSISTCFRSTLKHSMPAGGAIVRELQTLKQIRAVKAACCFYALDWNIKIIRAGHRFQQCQLFDRLLLANMIAHATSKCCVKTFLCEYKLGSMLVLFSISIVFYIQVQLNRIKAARVADSFN